MMYLIFEVFVIYLAYLGLREFLGRNNNKKDN